MEATLALAHPVPEQTPAEAVVAAQDLTRRYGAGETAVDALRGVSLEIPRGHLTAVMGPSGSGKSTLMHILAGLDRPTAGTVQIDGVDLTTLKDNDLTKLRRRHIGFVFQFFNLLPMLSAEENVTLPLSIAGEKPNREWLEELLDATGLSDRRSHRPAELSGGQQQRVAVARSLVSQADGAVRRRADGQPRLADVRRDPRPPPRRRRQLRPDDGDGHARPACGDDRRPHPVPRGRPDRERARSLVAGRDPRCAQRGVGTMRRVALRGLAARKLRSTLTAIAIVLGVAMVSGTLVLTDTIEKAFDSIFSSSYEQTDAVVSGKKLVEWSQTGKAQVSADVLARVRALPEVQAAAGTILDLSGDANQAKILDRDGKAIQGNNPTFGLGVEPEDERFNPFKLVEGAWASGARRGRRRHQHGRRAGLRRRRDGRRSQAKGLCGSYTLIGIARFGDVDSARRRHDRALRRGDRARGARQERRSTPSPSRPRTASRQSGCSTRSRHPAGHGRGADRRRAGGGGRRGRRRVRHVHPLLPARLRRHRALRRRLRHLQHALDHGRAADEGACDPADARRLAAAGAPLGRRSRGPSSASSPRRSASGSASCWRRG